MQRVAIAGSADAVHPSWQAPIDHLVHNVVTKALSSCGLELSHIDAVVTVASDTIDGVLVPLRGEIAGNLGRTYSHVTSSAGHGFGAAVSMIEAGYSERTLLVGWGAVQRFGPSDPRVIQADPFHARPVGALPNAVAALQLQQLFDLDRLDPAALTQHADLMTRLAWPALEVSVETAKPNFCDGAVAIVLERQAEQRNVAVKDFSSVSRAYSPDDEVLDPGDWVLEALSAAAPGARSTPYGVEVAGPTIFGELRALDVLARDASVLRNSSGGGALAWFGPATGLRQLAVAARALAGQPAGSMSIAADLSGPLSQHVTLAILERGGEA